MTPETSLFELVEIDSILIEDRSRAVDPVWVDALAAAFRATEMLNPITLWRSPEGPRLVAGAHRLAAQVQNKETYIMAKWSEAETFEAAKVLEITENIVRRDLSALDRAEHLFDLKTAYEELHPETKKGGDVKSETARKNLSEMISFSSDAAEKVGLSPRAIQLAVAMWKGLSPASKATAQGTWLADHQAGLMQLSKESVGKQAKALALIFPPEGKQPQATNVADALFILENGKLMNSVEKRFKGLNKTLNSLDDEELDAVLIANEERIMGWVERRLGGAK